MSMAKIHAVLPQFRSSRAKSRDMGTDRKVSRLRSTRTEFFASACFLILAAFTTPAAAQSGDRLDRIEREITALSAEVDRLEGARAVKKLQRAFGYYVDRGLWDEAADLFAEDGTIEIGQDGIYAGKPRVRAYLERLGGGHPGLAYGQLAEWLQLQPVVTLAPDGGSAKARWRDLGMLGDFGKSATWRDGIYENDYVRQEGVWKIRRLHLFVHFAAPYEGGWARLKPAAADWRSAAAKAFPPDRPPSARYRPFPEPQLPPFHYPNPVTGKISGKQP